MIHPALHNGGTADNATVTGVGTTVVVPGARTDDVPAGTNYKRRYLFIKSSRDNTEPVFLKMHPTESAEMEKGIVLYPGEFHEWTYLNMYQGPIRGITTSGSTALLYWHDGR